MPIGIHGDTVGDLGASCIRCGFCLESCPTFLLTGDESRSPRGRIAISIAAETGELGWEKASDSIDSCLGCRACETACPSGVHYGHLLELARGKMKPARKSAKLRFLLWAATSPVALRASRATGINRLAARLNLAPNFEPTRRHFARIDPQKPDRGEIGLLVGCTLRELFPGVVVAGSNLLERCGWRPTQVSGCCGALFAHHGETDTGLKKAEDLIGGSGLPMVSLAAGCGSWLKECGHEVEDISAILFKGGMLPLLQSAPRANVRVTYHDACHLAHAQRIRSQPRELIRAVQGIQFVEMREADMCCGSAGLYSMLETATARELLNRKQQNIAETSADIVVLGNPGCHAWIGSQRTGGNMRARVLHLAEFLELALSGGLE